MAREAIPCRTCGHLPVDAVPKTWTAAEVGDMVVAARICAHDDCANDAIAAVRKECDVVHTIEKDDPCSMCGRFTEAIRKKTGVSCRQSVDALDAKDKEIEALKGKAERLEGRVINAGHVSDARWLELAEKHGTTGVKE